MFNIDYLKSIVIHSTVFTIALIIPIGLGAANFGFFNIISLLLIALFSVITGKTVSRQIGLAHINGFSMPFEIIIGFSTLSFFQLVFTFLLKLNAVGAFFISCGFVFIWFLIDFKSQCASISNKNEFKLDLKSTVIDIVVLLFISIMATLWCREIITALINALQTGVFYAWPDIFLHTAEIVSLQNYHNLLNTSLYLAGIKQQVYHVASYAFSAFYSGFNHELSLTSAISFLVPCGIILAGLGVYGLGSILANRIVGVIAVITLFMLPDASMYGLKIGFFGYQWLMQSSPGSGYAIAIVLCGLGLYVSGTRQERFSFVIYAIILAVFSAIFRVQIAAPATVMMLILGLIVWKPSKSWYRVAGYLSLISLVVIAIYLSEAIDIGPHFLTGEYTGSKFFQMIHDRVLSSSYASYKLGNLYQLLITSSPLIVNWMIGYAVFLFSALGLIFPLLLFLIPKKLHLSTEWKIDIIPIALLLSSFLIIVFLPVPIDGDFSNFGHRQFVLIYAICLIFLTYWMIPFVAKFAFKKQRRNLIVLSICLPLIFIGLLTPWIYGKGIQQPKGWAENITETSMPLGLYNATQYLRNKSDLEDVILNSDSDQFATVVSLTERKAYISRNHLFSSYIGARGDLFRRRYIEIQELNWINKTSELCAFAEKRNIKWLLKYPKDFTNWNSVLLNNAIYESDGYRVYDLRKRHCN